MSSPVALSFQVAAFEWAAVSFRVAGFGQFAVFGWVVGFDLAAAFEWVAAGLAVFSSPLQFSSLSVAAIAVAVSEWAVVFDPAAVFAVAVPA